jgi:hypothetical protein
MSGGSIPASSMSQAGSACSGWPHFSARSISCLHVAALGGTDMALARTYASFRRLSCRYAAITPLIEPTSAVMFGPPLRNQAPSGCLRTWCLQCGPLSRFRVPLQHCTCAEQASCLSL